MTNYSRIAVAIAVVLVTLALLDIEPPKLESDLENLAAFRLWTAIEYAAKYFVAITIGTVIARGRFLAPAIIVAIASWLITSYILYQIASAAEPTSFLAIAMENLIGLGLWVIAGALGALLGGWFYRREFDRAPIRPDWFAPFSYSSTKPSIITVGAGSDPRKRLILWTSFLILPPIRYLIRVLPAKNVD